MVQELQTEENKILIALIFGIILLFLVSIGIIIFFILSRKKIIDKEREKTELQIEHQQKILQTSIAIQETERKRIAQDLHDDISSKLNVVSLTTNMLLADNDTSKKQKETLSQILEITSKTLESSRKIAHDLLPPILDKFGLKSALEELFEEFSKNTKIDIEYNVEELLLSQTNQLHVFRILQELINNSIRHGKANELSVYMEQDSKGFIIRYQDNGVGFKISDVNKKPGIGIQNIKSRVKILNGNLIADSTLGKGSQFIIRCNYGV
ncbi:sensor histidine kinase [uncultured Winogradskyella sp.]|uniref:sensor histidine kinase n=1 Tax=uncultured Winogradskyella sp. TaxID=395353 RepID=UPI0025F675E3|nr:sensor histidine kinase [uncultured Winogradskyella sp.]